MLHVTVMLVRKHLYCFLKPDLIMSISSILDPKDQHS